ERGRLFRGRAADALRHPGGGCVGGGDFPGGCFKSRTPADPGARVSSSREASLRAERMTAATDLLLALVSGGLSVPLLAGGGIVSATWGLVLAATAAAALAGAAFHATRYRVRPELSHRLWGWTLTLSLVVSAALVAAG